MLEDLGYPAYVLCLPDAKAKVFAIRMCKSNEPKGFKFSKPQGEQKGVQEDFRPNPANSEDK